MSLLRDALELLLAGEFICPFSHPDLHRAMRAPGMAEEISAALAPLGRTLGTLGEEDTPDTYFAQYADLHHPRDRAAATAQLVIVRDQLKPCLEFIRLFSQAGRSDACLAPGETISFADLLDAIERHVTYRDQLRDLSGHEFFSKSKSGKDNKDRLSLVLKALCEAGYLARRNSESANYVATGKMGYVYKLLAWLAEYHQLSALPAESEDAGASAQGGLAL
ncbi:hypothetical protein [Geopseudomonas aromaticivorans]